MIELYLFIYSVINYLVVVRGDEVLGCGGFLKSHVPIDFSKVEVRLITKQGIVKDRTAAAPNNGYYFVPLYDKGEMLLELSPPPGWSFEPKQVSLTIDGVTDLCSKGQDINFVFQGFGITGRVESLGGDTNGPAGITVQLNSDEGSITTTTDNKGQFFFTPVYPGNYKVSILHSKWKILKKSVDVKVAESNTELPTKSLVIQGYDVSGKVKSEGEPVKEATIILFSKDLEKNILVDGCNKERLKGDQFNNSLCHVTSNNDGSFVFGTVPNGQYYVIPGYKSQNIYFQPEKIEFNVNHNNVELKNFEIVGFSITGKVLKAKGVPINNAKLFLNGLEVARTNANGVYKLEKIKSGNHMLRVESEGLIFEEVTTQINPTLLELPDILPSAFKICGIVASDQSQIVTFSKLGTTKIIETETSLKDGSFCQYLSPGKYEVEVIVSNEDKQKGLQFFPLKQTVLVSSDKISNIIFSQLQATLSGRVKCIQPVECEGLTVILKMGAEETPLKVKDSSYSISELYPGTYELSIPSNKFCWESDKQTVVVNTAIANVPQFVQKGYTVNFVSSHDTKVHFGPPGEAKSSVVTISKGRSSHCLEKSGKYTFRFEGCHIYDPDTVYYSTDSDLRDVLLTAKKHSQKLAIKADGNYGPLKVSVKIGTKKTDETLKYAGGLYELEMMLEPYETAVIVPHSDILFFTPPILSVEGADDCSDFGVKVVAVKGKVFNGKIIPPLAGVTVTVESGDAEKLVLETDVQGIFKFPPLDNEQEYKIYATKESYILTGPNSDGNFLAHKLAEIIVEVVDEADNNPLSGALLSLSGGESYRKNLQSGENGKISFHSLFPSEYFLRPMMKEYIFEPSSKIIPVEEGVTLNVRLVGKRVAYGALGQVVSLNREPEENMVIVAVGLGNCSHFSEETTCESTGHFRIRGLQPYCSYKVIVKGGFNENQIIERSAPEFLELNSIQDDVRDLKLVVLRPPSHMDILVRVYTKHIEHYKSLKLKLIRESSSPVVIYSTKVDVLSAKFTKSINPGVLVNIPSMPIDHRPYSLQLESNSLQDIKPQVYQFNANTSFKFVDLDFTIKSNLAEQPIKQTSIWTLVFIFTVLFVLYNIEFVAGILRDKFNFNISSFTNLIPIPNSGQKNVSDYYDDAQIDQIVESINNAKKKPKPKKYECKFYNYKIIALFMYVDSGRFLWCRKF